MSESHSSRDALLAAIGSTLRAAPRPAPGLHVVATPIGNLADVSLRALVVLAEADVVACEDTRVTRRLFERYAIEPVRLVSYHEHNAERRRPELLARLDDGSAVALVSDAGTPLVSDPGYKLVRDAVGAGYPVFAVPGPSALLAGLTVAGLPTDRVWFEGFLPSRGGPRRARLAAIAGLDATLVFFESPRRAAAALLDMSTALGARQAVLARELTKRFETAERGALGELAARFADEPLKGEIVLVVAPPPSAGSAGVVDDAEIDARLARLVSRHGTREAAAMLAAETGLKRRDLYSRALSLARGGEE